jgi:hypothetical protein
MAEQAKRTNDATVAKLAERIARDLFTNGQGQCAQRLVLTVDTPEKRDLGGWSFGPAVDRIATIIELERAIAAEAKRVAEVR